MKPIILLYAVILFACGDNLTVSSTPDATKTSVDAVIDSPVDAGSISVDATPDASPFLACSSQWAASGYVTAGCAPDCVAYPIENGASCIATLVNTVYECTSTFTAADGQTGCCVASTTTPTFVGFAACGS